MEIDLSLGDPIATSGAIGQFIRDHVENAGLERAIVALSGGIDSAVTAALAVDALGPDRVVAHTLPDGQITPRADIEDAGRVAEALGIRCREISIHAPLESMELALKEAGLTGDREIWGNTKARLRMVVNYFVAHFENGLVLGTGNRSEVLIGYCTKHGDAGVDILPLAQLYKSQVRHLARHLRLPDRVIEKAPSAGLWEGQTDEAELGMSYQELDRVLVCLTEREMSVDETANALKMDSAKVTRIAEMIRTSAHKRAMPPMPDRPS